MTALTSRENIEVAYIECGKALRILIKKYKIFMSFDKIHVLITSLEWRKSKNTFTFNIIIIIYNYTSCSVSVYNIADCIHVKMLHNMIRIIFYNYRVRLTYTIIKVKIWKFNIWMLVKSCFSLYFVIILLFMTVGINCLLPY